jgi:hypothetical protein
MKYHTIQYSSQQSMQHSTLNIIAHTTRNTSVYSTQHAQHTAQCTHTCSRQYHSLSQMRPARIFVENAATLVCVLCLYVSLRYGTVRYGRRIRLCEVVVGKEYNKLRSSLSYSIHPTLSHHILSYPTRLVTSLTCPHAPSSEY